MATATLIEILEDSYYLVKYFPDFPLFKQKKLKEAIVKEYKEEAQCAQKGGADAFFVICGSIKHFFPNF